MCLLLSCIGFSCSSSSEISNSVYIWQRNWSPEVGVSIDTLGKEVNDFIVLAGSVDYLNGKLSVSKVNINWTELSKVKNEVVVAFRINTRVKKLLADGKSQVVVQATSMLAKECSRLAKEVGVSIAGVQFDYDCPTLKLKDYAVFVKDVRPYLGEYKISITALPTWLGNNSFKDLARATDYYVLQLHSFEVPKTINSKRQIFLKDKALSYVKKANRLKHPFSIALPTYGYEVGFDNKGKFLGLRAESEPIFWKNQAQVVREYSSSQEVLDFIRKLKKHSFNNLKEVCWFRMPIKGDEFNWSIKTLLVLLEDRMPLKIIKMRLDCSESGLCEVFAENQGEDNIVGRMSFDVKLDSGLNFYYDVSMPYRGKFNNETKGLSVEGPTPKVDQSILVCWLRGLEGHEDIKPIVSKVVFDEK